MSCSISTTGSTTAHHLVATMLAVVTLTVTAAGASADERCRPVNGHYVEHAVAPTQCPSAVGLCIEGQFSGGIRGSFASTATSLTPTADTPATAVVLFTGDGVVEARIGARRGNLFFKSAGAYRTVDTGEIIDLQVITGGTGALAGAVGTLQTNGTFDPATGSGESEYTGMVCLP